MEWTGVLNADMDAIVREARDGRADAFEVLVERHGPAMYRLASAIVGPDDACDVAQEAFVAAWRDLPRLRDTARFEPWLRRIVVNRSRNALRSRRRRPSEPLGTFDAHQGATAADFRDAIHARHELDTAFEGLSADHRAALVLHYGADLSISQTAEAMGVAVGTAKSRLNTALRHMRAVMEANR
jgi:RNA polymerase sigma-70 factor, ECF subfamily